MNQTGVASTGSRRQALRKRESITSIADWRAEQLARQRHEFVKPQGLVAKLGAERLDLTGLGVVQVVVTSDYRDRSVSEPRYGAYRAKKLQAARERHAK